MSGFFAAVVGQDDDSVSPGLLLMFGLNAVGQLGDGTVTVRSSPVQIGSEEYILISSGGGSGSTASTAGIRIDGTLWTWGENSNGVLGLGDTTDRSSPTQVGARTDWVFIDVDRGSGGHMMAITDAGELFAWGDNAGGILGLGDTTDRSSPVQVPGSFLEVSVGPNYTLAIRDDETLWGWGVDGSPGQPHMLSYFRIRTEVGNATISDGQTLTGASSGAVGVVWNTEFVSGSAGGGDLELNVRLSSLTGAFTVGETIGVGTTEIGSAERIEGPFSSPIQVSQDAGWHTLRAGTLAAAAFRNTTAFVWGGGNSGKLGLGDTLRRVFPTALGSAGEWSDICPGRGSASNGYMLGLRLTGALYAWGENAVGQLGQGNTTDLSSPTQIGALVDWASISAGAEHWLAIKADGTIWGCGEGGSGRLNNSVTTDRSSPVQIGTYANGVLVSAGLSSGVLLSP